MIARPAIMTGLLTLAVLAPACEPYRIEYRRRPAYYDRLTDEPLPDRVVRDDGTVVLYNARSEEEVAKLPTGDDPKLFKIREEREDGTVVLRSLLPEHVIANTLNGLRLEEYDLLWEQVVAERTKLALAAEDKGQAQFVAFLAENRVDLAKMLNRMRHGLLTHDVVVEGVGGGVIECRFWPQIETLFRFKRVRMVREGFGLKLLNIY